MKKITTVFTAVIAFSGIMAGNASAEKYEVKKGDTLWSISKDYNTSVNKLKEWNEISDDIIYPDQELTVVQQENYIVKKGDTLWDIANQYNVTVNQVKEWNQLHSDIIQPKDQLIIFPKGDKGENKDVLTATTVKNANASETKTSTKIATTKIASTKEKEIIMEATAYTASCKGCSGITATGVNLKKNPDAKVISVDPSVIPLGTKVYVEGYGYATAADTGGAIKGNKIDIFFSSINKAKQWGVKTVKVKILE